MTLPHPAKTKQKQNLASGLWPLELYKNKCLLYLGQQVWCIVLASEKEDSSTDRVNSSHRVAQIGPQKDLNI